MLAQILSASHQGLEVHPIRVEIDASRGLPSWDIVGLPDAAVKESKERVRTAIKNAGFELPSRRIVINLAPAHLRKEGPRFDLPIAIAILIATEQLPAEATKDYIFLGELGLSGLLRPVPGVLPIALEAKQHQQKLVVPASCAQEGAMGGVDTYGFDNLQEVVHFLRNPDSRAPQETPDMPHLLSQAYEPEVDFADIKGQYEAKRALEIVAAGGHNLIMVGSPGAGKTMLARALPGIMPPLTLQEALDVTKIYSIAGRLSDDTPLITRRPFRAPHHSSSAASLIGGGRIPQPGEVSLSHHGILFMDEFPEYRKDVLEALRQPLEDGKVTVSRIHAQTEFPCRFVLAASMNPCPCGYLNDPIKACTCSPGQVERYRHKISGPLLDRFDIQLEILPVAFGDLYHSEKAETTSAMVRKRVMAARHIQTERFKEDHLHCNGDMKAKHIQKYCVLDARGKQILERAFHQLGLSARGHHRILKIARTIADLEGSLHIQAPHLAEAIQYRSLDRKIWQG